MSENQEQLDRAMKNYGQDEMVAENDALRSKLAKAGEALRWYAAGRTATDAYREDCGHKARAALKEMGE